MSHQKKFNLVLLVLGMLIFFNLHCPDTPPEELIDTNGNDTDGSDTNGEDVEDTDNRNQCGNNICEKNEDPNFCPQDCPQFCGDTFCSHDETASSCPQDCDDICGDDICGLFETVISCDLDCKPQCPDNVCSPDETVHSCPKDCTASCGDDYCSHDETYETCPEDCEPFGVNLLTNPGAETGDMSGWTIIRNGTDGITGDEYGWAITAGGHSGDYSFKTSNLTCSRSQIVDLIAAGFSPATLDSAPPIDVGEWIKAIGQFDRFEILVELRDGDNEPMGPVFNLIDQTDNYSEIKFFEVSHTFTEYGSGLRYIYFYDSGEDSENWAGHYGARFDDAYVIINEDSESPKL